MAQINKPTDYFNTILWTGDGTSSRSITGVGFQPDLVWTKNRDDTINHSWVDVIRGTTKQIYSDLTNAEQTNATGLTAFDSDGFTVGSSNYYNTSSNDYVAWNWLGGGTASSNTDGTITSSVSANTTSGFSIVSYTGTGANATVGHGLGSEPKCIIVKDRDNVKDWAFYHVSLGNGYYMNLNALGGSSATSTHWNSTTPTSSVFSIGTSNQVNVSSTDFIAYCFAEKKGYSKFSSYVGNGSSTSPPFIYTGFKPAFVIAKRTTTEFWVMSDNKRDGYNPNKNLYPNATNAEDSDQQFNFYSNGFAPNSNQGSNNSSGQTYIYMCFAAEPLVGQNNIPATAR